MPASTTFAQATITGNNLALRSSGALSGATAWGLSQNGYVGTYVTLASPGSVTLSVNAQSAAGGGTTPHMNIVVDDSSSGLDVGTSAGDYATTLSLPAGTHFIRTELNNYSGRSLTLNSLTVSGGGATVANVSSDSNALAAANTYISNFRKGPATVNLTGPGGIPLLAGTPVQVYTGRNAFNFGGTVSGNGLNDSKDMLFASPAAGSDAFKFQRFINTHFGAIVNSNAGKWANNEATRNAVTMNLPDRQLNYAAAHNQRMRMHNLIWGSGATSGNQQPSWVNTLIASAAGGNSASATDLLNGINSRINYYAGTNGNRAQKYIEVDGLNESLHNPSYWNIYGASGIAGIYDNLQTAINAVGSNARIYLNEYNVLQFSPSTISNTGAQSGSDLYANWYRAHIDAVRAAGGAVTGVGMQEYTDVSQVGANAHTAATIQKALQNLSVTGLPLTMAEYGMSSGSGAAQSTAGATALDTAMRMFYGTPQATSFMIWGWWDRSTSELPGTAYPPAALLDNTQGNNVLTPMGTKWEALMNEWRTNQAMTVPANGQISFNGFYGDYYLSGQDVNFSNANILAPNALPFDMTLTKGMTNYNTSLVKPPNWFSWMSNSSNTWSASSSWTDAPQSGGMPSAAGYTAYFGSSAVTYNVTNGGATTTPITNNVSVTVSSPVTCGMLVFDNASKSYTINGPGAINLQGYNNADGHVTAVSVNAGNHTINAPLAAMENLTVTVVPPASTLTVSNLQSSSATLTKSGGGTLAVNGVRAPSLAVNAGTLRILPGGGTGGVSVVPTLAIAPGAALDLNDNKLITNNPVGTASGGVYDGVSRLIQTGRNPDGTGIVTSQPDAATGLASNGVAAASDVKAIAATETATWAGQTVTGSQTLVMYTYAGDANLDGKINVDDYGKIDFNMNLADASGWINGDFNYDGKINVDDYGIIDSNVPIQGAPFPTSTGWPTSVGLSSVPEPSLGILVLLLPTVSLRRRRRSGD